LSSFIALAEQGRGRRGDGRVDARGGYFLRLGSNEAAGIRRRVEVRNVANRPNGTRDVRCAKPEAERFGWPAAASRLVLENPLFFSEFGERTRYWSTVTCAITVHIRRRDGLSHR